MSGMALARNSLEYKHKIEELRYSRNIRDSEMFSSLRGEIVVRKCDGPHYMILE